MSISQLDLVLLGGRAITSRIGSIESALRGVQLGQFSGNGSGGVPTTRTNLLSNSSFEFYHRNDSKPQDWTLTGSVSIIPNATGADGTTSLQLAAGANIQQQVAGGMVFSQGAFVLSVAVKSQYAGQLVSLSVQHTPGVSYSTVQRLSVNGELTNSAEVPADGQWYRFFVQGLITGGDTVTATIGCAGGAGTIEIDAAKFEFEAGSQAYIDPTAYQGGDWGGSSAIRNFKADNIVAGTLTVGGSGTDAPRISVLDANDTEIVTIGDANGTYGIEVKAAAGIEVSGAGSIEVTGGGSIEVGSTGSVKVTGSGKIVAGTEGAARTEITDDGIAAYNSSNVKQVEIASADGRMYVYGKGGVVLSGGGSFIAGTPGGTRAEYDETGFSSYNAYNELQARLSAISGKLELSADAIVLLSSDPLALPALSVSGEVTVGQDLRVGANVLFVDQSQSNVGINKAPDPQFDLDVAGSVRWGGYGVGKMALQLKEALLIAHYDGAGVVGTDLTGDPTGHKGQKATVTGSLSYPAGKFNKGVQLASEAQLAYKTSGNLLAASGTIAMWVKPTGTNQVMFACGTASPNWIRLAVGADAVLQGWYGNAYLALGSVTLNQWHHIALTWSGGNVSLYLNGVLLGSSTGATVPTLASSFYVGSDQGGGNRWTGVIDDLTILGVAADADLVRAIYESDAPVFAETSNWGFRTANTLAWADEEGLWAIDGSGNAAFGVSGVDSKSWGGITLDKGDVLIGRNANYVRWDASAGTMTFRGNGGGLTNINGANITTGSITADKLNVSSLSAISANIGNITAGNITGVNITGSTFTAGNGAVVLNSNGIYVVANNTESNNRSYEFYDGSAFIGGLRAWQDQNGQTMILRNNALANGKDAFVHIQADADANSSCSVYVWAYRPNGQSAYLGVSSGPLIGRIAYADVDKFRVLGGDVNIGKHPAYSIDYAAFWREGYDYTILSNANDTFINSRSGAIYFRDNNSTRGYFNSSGLYVVGNLDAGFVKSRSWASFGSTGTNYLPNNGNWTTGGATLLLNGADYTSIAFHDAGNRVDTILVGGGYIELGYDAGWGNAQVYVPNRLGVGVKLISNSTNRLAVRAESATASHNALLVQNSTPSTLLYLRGDGYAWVNQNWVVGSDSRLKTNIRDSDRGLGDIKRVCARRYKRLINDREEHGFIAEEIREVMPELVSTAVVDDKGTERLAVNYGAMIPILVRSIQELAQMMEDLQAEVARLKANRPK